MITPVVRRILPGLRLYSSWLLYSLESMTTPVAVNLLATFWENYVQALNCLLTSLDLTQGIPAIDYLLEEDELTIGLSFFATNTRVSNRFLRKNGTVKPNPSNGQTQREHPTQEMLGRVVDFIADAVGIAQSVVCRILLLLWEDQLLKFSSRSHLCLSISTRRLMVPLSSLTNQYVVLI